MKPEQYRDLRDRNKMEIRRLQREIDAAEKSAVECPPPDRSRLRAATIDDIFARRVIWLDYGDEGFEWRIPSDEPHPTATHFIDIDGEPSEWVGAFVEENAKGESVDSTALFGLIPVSEQRPPLIEDTPETNGFFLLLRHNPARDAAGKYRMHLWFGSVPIDSTHWERIPSLPND